MNEPFRAFPSWFLRVTCDRCGKVLVHDAEHMTERQRGIVLRAHAVRAPDEYAFRTRRACSATRFARC